MAVNDTNKYMFYTLVYIPIVLFYFRLILLLMKHSQTIFSNLPHKIITKFEKGETW